MSGATRYLFCVEVTFLFLVWKYVWSLDWSKCWVLWHRFSRFSDYPRLLCSIEFIRAVSLVSQLGLLEKSQLGLQAGRFSCIQCWTSKLGALDRALKFNLLGLLRFRNFELWSKNSCLCWGLCWCLLKLLALWKKVPNRWNFWHFATAPLSIWLTLLLLDQPRWLI